MIEGAKKMKEKVEQARSYVKVVDATLQSAKRSGQKGEHGL